MIKLMIIGNVKTEGNLFLAPMAGVTDVGFREAAAMCGASLTYTEMVSASALLHNSVKSQKILLTTPAEKVKAVQMFGKDPVQMAEALRYFEGFDFVDINMGCPAPKIVKNGEGSALMNSPVLASEIISACVKAAKVPVTVKIRKGFNSNVAVSFARMCEESGASAVTVHGRTREEMYIGNVDFEVIASVKAALKIPVIGNGDVKDEKKLQVMLAAGVDGVMIGRAALGRPWIFSELSGKKLEGNPIDYVKVHINRLKKYFSEAYLVKYLRKHMLWYASEHNVSKETKRLLALLKNLEIGIEILESILKEVCISGTK